MLGSMTAKSEYDLLSERIYQGLRGGWGESAAQRVLLVFAGFCIGWVSTTIARYIYPPPRRWTSPQPPRHR
jgi:hypothetical protein